MSALANEMKAGLRHVAGPDGNVKARIGRAARRLGISFNRAFDLWYGRARRIDAHEIEAIRAKHIQGGSVRDHIAGEATEILERLARVEAHLLALREGGAVVQSDDARKELHLVVGILGRSTGPLIGGGQ